MASRVQIGESIKGALRQNEDWWYLVLEDDGSCYVEHEWSYVDPYGRGKPNSGTKTFTVEEFLAGDSSEGMKSELRSALKKSGEADA